MREREREKEGGRGERETHTYGDNYDKRSGGWLSRERDEERNVVENMYVGGRSRVNRRAERGGTIGGSESLVPSIYSACEPVDNG